MGLSGSTAVPVITPPTTDGMTGASGRTAGAQVVVDTSLYGMEALFRACYKFTDRCFLFLERGETDRVIVHLRPQATASDVGALVDNLVGSFQNELIDQRLRVDLARETHSVREWVVAQAFVEADLDVSPR